jgi:hypothetical protein
MIEQEPLVTHQCDIETMLFVAGFGGGRVFPARNV